MHYVCTYHQSEAVLWRALGWLPNALRPAQDACDVCWDVVLASAYDLAQADLAEEADLRADDRAVGRL